MILTCPAQIIACATSNISLTFENQIYAVIGDFIDDLKLRICRLKYYINRMNHLPTSFRHIHQE